MAAGASKGRARGAGGVRGRRTRAGAVADAGDTPRPGATCRCGGARSRWRPRRCWWPASRSAAGSSPGRSRRSPSTNATGWWSATCTNLTGDPRLDDALEQAFRISLEQSRYVNVLQRPQGARHAGAHAAQAGRPRGPQPGLGDRPARRRARRKVTAHRRGSRRAAAGERRGDRSAYPTTVYAVSADGRGGSRRWARSTPSPTSCARSWARRCRTMQKTSVPLPNVATPQPGRIEGVRGGAQRGQHHRRSRAGAGALSARPAAGPAVRAGACPDMARVRIAWRGRTGGPEWRKALQFPATTVAAGRQWIELMLLQHDAVGRLLPQGERVRGVVSRRLPHADRVATNHLAPAQRLPFGRGDGASYAADKPQNDGPRHQLRLGVYLLGQDKVRCGVVQFRKARGQVSSAYGRIYARAFDLRWDSVPRLTGLISRQAPAAATAGRAMPAWSPGSIAAIGAKAGEEARRWATRPRPQAIRSSCCGRGQPSQCRQREAGATTRPASACCSSPRAKVGRGGRCRIPPTSTEVRLYAGLLAAPRR